MTNAEILGDIPPKLLLPSITHLTLSEFDQPLDHLPSSISQLNILVGTYSHPLDNLPPNLHHLKITGPIDHSIDHLPSTLTDLTIVFASHDSSLDYLPQSLSHLTIRFDLRRPPRLDHLPSCLVSLTIQRGFNSPIDHLPHSLKTLNIWNRHQTNQQIHFNQPVDHLPANLTTLFLGREFNQPIDHLPSSLLHLTLGSVFNHPLDNLPQYLLDVGFVYQYSPIRFNLPLDNLPPSLQHLKLGEQFNQPIDHLPPSLQSLIFIEGKSAGPLFDQPVDHLPSSLKTFTIESSWHVSAFNQPVDYLPPSLTSLTLGESFSHPVDHLPTTLKHLALKSRTSGYVFPLDNLPQSLCDLEAHQRSFSFDNLPPLKSMEFFPAVPNYYLPSTLTKLNISYFRDTPLPRFPTSLTTLSIDGHFENLFWDNSISFSPLTNLTDLQLRLRGNSNLNVLPALPPSLKNLYLMDAYFNAEILTLPTMLQFLNISSKAFSHSIPYLPSLTRLIIHADNFNLPLLFPSTLLLLDISSATFNQPITLPPSIHECCISSQAFNQSLLPIPASLRVLYLECSSFKQDTSHIPPYVKLTLK